MQTKLKIITGLHIGGSDDTMSIGGIDSSVIKREIYVNQDGSICYSPEYDKDGSLKNGVKKITEPYIPGSSIKGKVRSLLELTFGLIKKQKEIYKKNEKRLGIPIDSEFYEKCDNEKLKEKAKLIIALFGESAGNKKSVISPHITRAIFRDSFLTKETRKLYLENKISLSEEKAENTINRVTVSANPRFIERVPAGVEFNFEVILRELDEDKDLPLQKTLELGLLLLQNDALGGGGSRGNGKIEFSIFDDIENLDEEIKNRMEEIEKELEK